MSGVTEDYDVRVGAPPALRVLASFPVACFCIALGTDLAYWGTEDLIWAEFSDWLLAIGILVGVVAALAGAIYALANLRRRALRPSLPFVVGILIVLALAFVNNLVHSRDAWTSVVPFGLVLSALTVVMVLATAWAGGRRVRRTVVAPAPVVAAPAPSGVR